MNYVIVFIISLALGFFLGRTSRKGEGVKSEEVSGLKKVNAESQAQKEERKNRILELFNNKNNITNNDIEALLDVSDATATNYLSELEKEGKIEQTGVSGRFVSYKFKG